MKNILPRLQVGKIKDYDPDKYKNFVYDDYVNDPVRKTDALEYHSVTPCNAETKQEYIMDGWITPNEDFFIRNHY